MAKSYSIEVTGYKPGTFEPEMSALVKEDAVEALERYNEIRKRYPKNEILITETIEKTTRKPISEAKLKEKV